MKPRADVLTLMIGVAAILVALGALFVAFVSTPTSGLLRFSIPAALVVIGVAGALAAARR